MDSKKKNLTVCILFGLLLAVAFLACLFLPKEATSDSERRKLAAMPAFTLDTVLSGRFMSGFETYTQDHFPFRDQFRTLKALSATGLFHRQDNNGIYVSDGFAAAVEYPLNESSLDRAAGRFQYLYDKYLNGSNRVFLSVIPDKNCFLARESGHLSMDYAQLESLMAQKVGFADYISISDLLERDFYGGYCGQSALPLAPESIHYLINDAIRDCTVYDYQNNRTGTVYDMERAMGKDPYEIFLSGSLSLITMENPYAQSGRELVLFRDSFGSSIAPLLLSGYSRITLVDIRYIQPDYLGQFIDFENCDVLFLYSSLVLNNSDTLK